MWEDIKRLVAVIASHLREQKDTFIYKLIVANYSSARDQCYRRLGERYYKAYKEGRITEIPDEGAAVELDSLLRIEDEIELTAREIDALRAHSYRERDAALGHGGKRRPAAPDAGLREKKEP